MVAVLNRQNDRIYAHDAIDLPEGSQSNLRFVKPVGVMVWAAIVSNGSKSSLFFIPKRIMINSLIYIEILEPKMLPCVSEQLRVHPRRNTFTHIKFDSEVVQGPFYGFLEQRSLASIKPIYQHIGLCYLVHFRESRLCLIIS